MSGSYLLDGSWNREREPLVLRSPAGRLRFRLSAAKMHLAASAPQPAVLRVSVDGRALAPVDVEHATLYTLLDGNDDAEHVLDVESDTPGLSLYSVTFD